MRSFAELLQGLDAMTARSAPTGDYTHGQGLAAHTLMALLVSPDTPPAARIAAVREIADRCEGRPRVGSDLTREGSLARWEDLSLAEITQEELSTLVSLLRRVGWGYVLDSLPGDE